MKTLCEIYVAITPLLMAALWMLTGYYNSGWWALAFVCSMILFAVAGAVVYEANNRPPKKEAKKPRPRKIAHGYILEYDGKKWCVIAKKNSLTSL